jgi:hypothetical protein
VRNSALGQAALNANTTGGDNTAMGALALQKNTTGAQNTAIGASALIENLTGVGNTAYGAYSLDANILGNNNTAVGGSALGRNVASNNTAIGAGALDEVTTGANNVGVGVDAGGVIATGSNNIAIGGGIFTTGSNNIVIGHPGVAAEDAHIRIGTNGVHTDTRLGGVNGIAIPGPTLPVLINANGQMGTATASSERFKDDVRDMDAKSEQLLALRPVTFRYREGVAPEGDARAEQYGLIAEEVAQVNPDWAIRDADGVIVSVRYDQVNAALLGLVQRQQAQIDALNAKLEALSRQVAGAKAADTP